MKLYLLFWTLAGFAAMWAANHPHAQAACPPCPFCH